MNIPAGALAQNVTITVTAVTPPGPGSLGTVYDLGPNGTTFTTPITLAFHYAGLNLDGQPASDLRLATYLSGGWQTLTGFAEDTGAMTVSGTTTHFTYYAPILPAPGDAGGDGGGPVCACATMTSSCSEYPPSMFQAGGSCTGTPTGYTGECCFSPGQPVCVSVASSGGETSCPPGQSCPQPPPPSCADGDATEACSNLPGATETACMDNSTGFVATCCFATGAQSCFVATTTGAGCPPPGTGCPPPPTCDEEADAGTSPCDAYAGSMQTGCMDSPAGPSATCCFPQGVLPGVGDPTTAGPWPGTPGGSTIPDAGTGPTPGCHPETVDVAMCFASTNITCNLLPGLGPDAGPMGCSCSAVNVGGEACGGCLFSFGCMNGVETCTANMAPYDSGAMNAGTCNAATVCATVASAQAEMTSQNACVALVP